MFRRLLPTGGGGALPTRFDKATFCEQLGFGLKLQATNLISFSFEPLTKFVISATAGLTALGLFEMAYRTVLQVRHIVAAPLQTLLPTFAHLNQVNKNDSLALYSASLASTLIVSSVLLFSLALISPLVSIIWLGHLDWIFCLFTAFCSVGWFFNVVGAPAYLFGISSNYLSGNIRGHLVTSFAGPGIGYVACLWLRLPWLSVALPMAGLAGGAVIAAVMNSRALGLPLLPQPSVFRVTWRKLTLTLCSSLNRNF